MQLKDQVLMEKRKSLISYLSILSNTAIPNKVYEEMRFEHTSIKP